MPRETPEPGKGHEPPSAAPKCRALAPPTVAFLVVLLVYQYRLDTPALWGDEADTGNFARSVIAHGVPSALLPHNVLAYQDCFQLSANLLSKRLPWLQYYVGAASIWLFGDDTAGLRRLFAAIGALAFVPLWLVLRKRGRAAALAAATLLLAPQAVLFGRQARYYPLVTTLFCVWMWNLDTGPNSTRLRRAVSIACALLLFQAHPVVAFGAAAAICGYSWLQDRARFRECVLASLLGLGTWFAWYLTLPSIASRTPSPLALALVHPAAWARRLVEGTVAGARDLDYVGSLPTLACLLVAAAAVLRKRTTQVARALRGAGVLVIAALVVQVVVTAAAAGVERDDLAVLRYMPHVAVLLPMALLLACGAAFAARGRGVFLFAVAMATTILSVGLWLPRATRNPMPLSWWPPTYQEILRPPPDDVYELVGEILARTQGVSRSDPVGVLPTYCTDTFVYYLGGRHRLVPDTVPFSDCSNAVAKAVGDDAWARMHDEPGVVVVFGGLESPVPEFDATRVPLRRSAPDGSRPELTRHVFPLDLGAGVATLLVARDR